MAKSYGEIRQEMTPEQGDDAGEALLPCTFCERPTKRKVLSMLGARCQKCFDAYLKFGYSGTDKPTQMPQSRRVRREAERIANIAKPKDPFGTGEQ